MAAPTVVPPVNVTDPSRQRQSEMFRRLIPGRPAWSRAAALRALRASIVIPGTFALTDRVIGDLQMATFAAFGGFATLVLANFGGTRRNLLVAHTCLGIVGSALLIIGTAVTNSTPLAVFVTVLVGFSVLFAGISGPNAASAATAALLAYVLPAASPGNLSMISSRLEGWWLATGAGTLAVLALSPGSVDRRLRSAVDECASVMAATLQAALSGDATEQLVTKLIEAKVNLMATFGSTPFRPTGLARSDQAMDRLVESLEWCGALVVDAVRERGDLHGIDPGERELLRLSADGLRSVVSAAPEHQPQFDVSGLDDQYEPSCARVTSLDRSLDRAAIDARNDIHTSFHARMVASAVRAAVVNAEILETGSNIGGRLREGSVGAEAKRVVGGHASLRSVWFLNSARGAVALAAAVAVADLVHVQHGFWVVLGTLSVLRTNAASTGSTALTAVGGTGVGFFVGGGLILAIGHDTGVLWGLLPVAIFVAAYAPGILPFAVGQAFFTVTISVLYNILQPVGWRVGVLRIEDVAIGAGVSVLVGFVFWPRGASSIVAGDLADAFHVDGLYLVQATGWAVGSRTTRPEAAESAVVAELRLDEAMRAFIAEQGAKRVKKEHVWRLVGAAMRIRLTARSLGMLSPPELAEGSGSYSLVQQATRIAGQCDGLASELGRTVGTAAQELAAVTTTQANSPDEQSGYLLWVQHHLDHVQDHLADLVGPTAAIQAARDRPWWR